MTDLVLYWLYHSKCRMSIFWSYWIWSDGIPNRSALQGPPLQSDKWHRFYRIKYFTNGRLRIDSFQPIHRLRGKDAIMGCFNKLLIIKVLYFWRFVSIANSLKWRCRYGAIAMRLRCNGDAITVQSRCDYGVTATRLYRNGKQKWPKTRRRRCQEAEGYPFSALFAPVFKC